MNQDDGAWQAFQRWISNEPVVSIIETSWVKQGPDPARPFVIIVSFPVRSPNENGFPHGDELTQLQDAEGLVSDALERSHRAMFLASLTGRKKRVLLFASASNGPADRVVHECVGRVGCSLPVIKIVKDPTWRYIQEAWPTPLEKQWAMNQALMEALASSGDRADIVRPIEHWAYLPTQDAQARFVAWAKDAGFKVLKAPSASDDDGRWRVQFQKKTAATSEAVWEQTKAAMEMAESLQGEYDGWECGVCKG